MGKWDVADELLDVTTRPQKPKGRFDVADEMLSIDWQKELGDQSFQVAGKTINAPMPSNIDTTTGAPALDRAAAGIKISTEGKMNYLRQKYGDENVGEINGEIVFRPKGEQKWVMFDEQSLTLRDLADFSGDAIEMIPAVAVGMATANPMAAGAAAAGGNAIRQAVGGMIPGDSEMGVGERALDVGMAGALGAGGQKVGNLVSDAIDLARPRNILSRAITRSDSGPQIAAMEQLAGETGIDFSSAQMTGSRLARSIEGFLRQNPSTADMVNAGDLRRLGQLEGYMDNILDNISIDGIGKEGAGYRAARAYKNYVGELVSKRSVAGRKAFGEVKRLSGDAEIFPIDNFISEIDQLTEDVSTSIGTDTATRMVDQLQSLKSKIINEAGEAKKLRAMDFQNALRVWGDAATGKGNALKIYDKSVDQMVASRVFGALQRDLDNVAKSALPESEVGQALKHARDTWKTMSQGIEATKKNVLGKTLDVVSDTGVGAERVVDKFVSKAWKESEVKQAMSLLDDIDPIAARSVRRQSLETIFAGASPGATVAQGGRISTSPAKLASIINRYRDQIKGIFHDDPAAIRQMNTLMRALNELSDRAGTGGSQTAFMQQAGGIVNMVGGGVKNLFTDRTKLLQTAMEKWFAPRTLARLMLNPEGRSEVINLVKMGAKGRQVAALLPKLELIEQREGWIDAISEMTELRSDTTRSEEQGTLQK